MSAAPGPPAPDAAEHESDWRRPHSEMLKLAAAHAPSPGTTHGDCPGCQMAADIRALVAENARLRGAAVPAPPAGLTVETLAALLAESPLRVPPDGWEWDEPTPEAATWPEHLAAWLLPRLGPVSPGAPAAARRAPTDAMIDAARKAFASHWPHELSSEVWPSLEHALRAALAAGQP